LLAIAVADAAVVYYGVHLHDKPAKAANPSVVIQTPIFTGTPSASPTPTVALTQNAAHVEAGVNTPPAMLAAWDQSDVWRAIGNCGQVNSLIATTSSGSRFYLPTQPAPYIIALNRTGPLSGWVIASDARCLSIQRFRTTDGGVHWKLLKKAGKEWLSTPIGVATPAGKVVYPCGKLHPTPLELTSEGPRGDAIAMCPHKVVRTSNGGATWKPVGDVLPGQVAAVALARNGSGVLVMTRQHGCSGARILNTIDGGVSWTYGMCLRVVDGPVSVSIGNGGGGMLLSAKSKYLTTDYGKTWD
jgi:hypothetical protein